MIDINFDFTTDSYKYWEGFWERKDGRKHSNMSA